MIFNVDLSVGPITPILVIFCHSHPMGHRRSQRILSGRLTKTGLGFKEKMC